MRNLIRVGIILQLFCLATFGYEQTETKTAIKTKRSGVARGTTQISNAKSNACEGAKKKALKADCGWFKGDVVDLKPSNLCDCKLTDTTWRCKTKYTFSCLKKSVKTKKSEVAVDTDQDTNNQATACARAKRQANSEASCKFGEGHRTQLKVDDKCRCSAPGGAWRCDTNFSYTCTKEKERKQKPKKNKKK